MYGKHLEATTEKLADKMTRIFVLSHTGKFDHVDIKSKVGQVRI
jgi:hypothetical protein